MSKPESINQYPAFLNVKQVSEYLQLNEKKVYSLANEGHIPATKATGKWMFPRELIDRWMLDSSHSGLLKDRLVISGSDDPLLFRVINNLSHNIDQHALITYSPNNTSIGLKHLQAQRIDICAIHWGQQAESDTRHPALLQQYSQSKQWILIRAFQREQGLMINPEILSQFEQYRKQPGFFLSSKFRWTKRSKESGSQRFLYELLSQQHLFIEALNIENEAKSEREAAAMIAMNQVDIATGTRASANEFGLGFISINWESVDLALPRNIWFRRLFQVFMDELKSTTTQQVAATLEGYDLANSGELVWGDD